MSKYYDLVFFSTCTNSQHIGNLYDSVAKNNVYIKVGLFIFFQNGVKVNFSHSNSEYLDLYELSSMSMHSLSNARNRCIEYYTAQGFKSEYVMFPDDDTTFDEEFFKSFSHVVSSNMLIDVLCTGKKNPYMSFKNLQDGQLTSYYKYAMSVNMIIRTNNVLEIGGFDELLGVGARFGAGEDGDFFIRVCKKYGSFVYTDKLWNYHPSADSKNRQIPLLKLLKRYKSYGEGVIFLLVKHKMYLEAFKCVLSGFAGSIMALLLEFNVRLSLARLYAGFVRLKSLFQFLLIK